MTASPQHPAPETLLAQQDFIRTLVRSLLRGADGEDDVVQRTWLQAWRRPPRDAGRSRQWLASVARNLARDHLRSSRRRGSRERLAARPEAVPSTADVVQREAERQRVVEALLGLAEPYRSTVLLRYWEDLSPAAIAARLDVPGATVRARLQRGLAMLRQKLDHDYGDRRAWLVALTPFATLARPTVALPIAGALAMSVPSKITLTVCGLALATLAFWTFGLPGDATHDDRVAPIAPPTLTGAPTAERDAANAAADAPVSLPRVAATETDFVLNGEVLCSGESFAGLALNARWFEGTDPDGEPTVEVELRSDANGAFTWHQPRPAGTITIRFSTADPRRKIFAAPVVVFAGAESADCVIDVVRLDCTLRGHIRNREGAPIAGATVNLNAWHDATSDADGRYEINVTTGDDCLPLIAYADGYAEQVLQTNVPAGATTHPMDITLQPGMTMAGRVVDKAGVPVAGARVSASGAMQRPITGADGRFAFGSIGPESRHEIEARKRGFAPAKVYGQAGEDNLELVLRPGVALVGTVRDSSGRPIAGASIGLFLSPHSGLSHGAYSELDGRFRIDDLEPGTSLEVRAQKSGFATASRQVELADTDDIEFRLEPGRTLRGRVVDAAGAPIAGASVDAERAGDEGLRRAVGARCDSAADGRFEVRDLPAEACHVYAFKAGYLRGSQQNVFGGGPELSIRLQPAPAVAGRVIDAATRAPLDLFTVQVAAKREDLGRSWSKDVPFSGTDGYWRSQEGAFTVGQKLYIEVRAEGYAPCRTEVIAALEPAADGQVTALLRGVTLAGSVRRAGDGQPVADARIKLLLEDDDPQMVELLKRDATTSGADGTFALPAVGAGAVRLYVAHADYTSILHGPLEVGAGPGQQHVDLVLGVGARVAGRVVGFAQPQELELRASSIDHVANLSAEVSTDGSFELRNVPAGTYVISVHTSANDGRFVRLQVGTDDIADVEIRAHDGDRRLEVTVPGADAGQARLRPLDKPPAGQRFSTRWLEFTAGSLAVDGLAPIRYELRVEVGDKHETQTLELGRQLATRVTVEMR